MPQPTNTAVPERTQLMSKLWDEKKAAVTYQERRHEDWNMNYELNRNKIRTNRLTQRQEVGIPLMKETNKTLLSRIDDPPEVDLQELDGDEQKEIYMQEMWNSDFDRDKFELIDLQDKKNVLLTGRSTKKIAWVDGGIKIWVLDPFDFLVDPFVDPLDIETARYVIHQNIFRSLREILADDRYTEEGKAKLKQFMSTRSGVIQSARNKEEMDKKLERLKSMGVTDTDFATFDGGEAIVNLSEHIHQQWSEEKKAFERRAVVYADDAIELLDMGLKEYTGIETYPYESWADDPETNDYWSDGVSDMIRPINLVVNVWYSQYIENRTLSNFGMTWYDATKKGYQPKTYEPGPGRMLPAPGNPRETLMPVEINSLEDTLQAIEFLIRVGERGSGATAIEKGVSEKKQITLGEVETLLGKAAERQVTTSTYYRASWERIAVKWLEMMNANASGSKKLFKLSSNGKMYPKTVKRADWFSKTGYRAVVNSSSEQEAEKVKSVQTISFLRQQSPNNPVLRKLALKRGLELERFTPEERRQVEEAEEQIVAAEKRAIEQQQEAAQGGQPGLAGGQGGGQPIEQTLNELEQAQNA